MGYLSATLVTILAVELLLRLPLMTLVTRLSALLQKVSRVISSKRISDHWKEKVLLGYARSIAILTFKIAATLIGTGLAVMLGSLILDRVLTPQVPTIDSLMSFPGIGLATIVSIVYFLIRRRLISQSYV